MVFYIPKNGTLRKLSGYESLLLQGFSKQLAKKVIEHKLPDGKILSQAGNAMTVTVIEQIGKQLLKSIGEQDEQQAKLD